MNQIQIQNMHEVMSLDIPLRTMERAKERIDFLNKIKVKVQGWIVDYVPTDKNGVFDEGGKHVTGYFMNEGDPRHGQLVTTSTVENMSTFQGYHVMSTSGLSNKPYFLLEWGDDQDE